MTEQGAWWETCSLTLPSTRSDASDAAMSDDHEIELFALSCGNERALGTPHRHLPDGTHSE